MKSPKENAIAYLMWAPCIVGVCGIHRFYLGKHLSGVVWLCTFGLCGIGQIVDLLLIPSMVSERNLIAHALSEDIRNDAIRQATIVMASIQESRGGLLVGQAPNQSDAEQVLLQILSSGESLTFGKLCVLSGLKAIYVKNELDHLARLGIVSLSNSAPDNIALYRLE
jgi:TM2 domain-containing membrane protein YozV